MRYEKYYDYELNLNLEKICLFLRLMQDVILLTEILQLFFLFKLSLKNFNIFITKIVNYIQNLTQNVINITKFGKMVMN